MADHKFLTIKTLPDHITLEDVKQLEQYNTPEALFSAMLLRVLIELRDDRAPVRITTSESGHRELK